jgi:hypothetical protein
MTWFKKKREAGGSAVRAAVVMTFVLFVELVLGVKLSVAQHVLAAVAFDGVQPRAMTRNERRVAKRIFGGEFEVTNAQRGVVAIVAGARSGKSRLFGAARLVHLGMTLALDALAPSEMAYGPVVAPDLRLARHTFSFIVEAVEASVRSLGAVIVGQTTDSLAVQRADGRKVCFVCLPATRGGSALRGRSLFGALLDEVAFFRDENFAVNDAELYRAIAPRVLRGGQIILVSTPWAKIGLLWEFFRDFFGKPKGAALVAHAPTIVMRDDAPEILELVERETKRDPANARREHGAEFPDNAASAFTVEHIDKCVDVGVTRRPRNPECDYGASGDLGFRGDGAAMTIGHREIRKVAGGPPVEILVQDVLLLARAEKGGHLDPERLIAWWSSVLRDFGVRKLHLDGHGFDLASSRFRERGVECVLVSMSNADQNRRFDALAGRIRNGTVRLLDDPTQRRELSELRCTFSSGGIVRWEAPRRAHASDDCADALALLGGIEGLAPGGGDVSFVYEWDIRREVGVFNVERKWFERQYDPVQRCVVRIPTPPPVGSLEYANFCREHGIVDPANDPDPQPSNVVSINAKVSH